MNKIIFLLAALACASCSNQSGNKMQQPNDTVVTNSPVASTGHSVDHFKKGVWNCKDKDGGGTIFGDKDTILLSLSDNQIQIQGRVEKKAGTDNLFDVFYVAPSDLGAGGMEQDWDNYSKEKPITRFERINDTMIVKKEWMGFYNVKSKKVENDLALDWDVCDTIIFYKAHLEN